MYCNLCKRYIEPKKKFNWIIFLLGILTFGVVSIGYTLYYLFLQKADRCPICNTKNLNKYSPEDAEKKKIERSEKIEKTKETLINAKDKVTEIFNKAD